MVHRPTPIGATAAALVIANPHARRVRRDDWRKPAEVLDRQVRALQPWPGAWTTIDGRRLHVRAAHPTPGIDGMPMGALLPGAWPEVATGQGALALDVVQPEGRPAMPADAWRRGLGRDHVLLGAGGPEKIG